MHERIRAAADKQDKASPRAATNAHERAAPRRTPRSTPLTIQRSMTVGAADDPLERDADAVADAVMRSVPLAAATGAHTRVVRRSPAVEPPIVDPAVESRIRASGGGQPLDRALRRRMEPAMDADLGNVRVHRNSDIPARINARAFALGDHVHFAPGEFDPATASGVHVLAHELAHTIQQDRTIRRLVKFDEVLDNVVTTWRDDAMQKFRPTSSAERMKTVDFVVTNLKRGVWTNPLPADFELCAPHVHPAAVAAARTRYTTNMVPLYDELVAMTPPLGARKQRIGKIRTDLQTEWDHMVEDLGDDHSAAKVELQSVARKVADEILALEAVKKRKALKKERDAIVQTHAADYFGGAFFLEKAANQMVSAAKQPLPAWQQNAKDKLTGEQLAMFNKERHMVELRLDQWKTKQKGGQGVNTDGTYGTSFGGSGAGFAHNPLPMPVYDALKVWWNTTPGPTWSTQSLTTDYSLKKQRITPHADYLSPRFNYHIEIATT